MAIPNEQETLAQLAKEKQHTIRIKKDKNNPNYVTDRVFVNGVCIQIPVGEEVKVSETVKKLLILKGVL